MSISSVIKGRIKRANARFYACDNVSEFIQPEEKNDLILELTEKFEGVLDSLIIDTENDPNSKGTAKRLAKMYMQELMSGRYDKAPDCTAFPNDGENIYSGMLVVRAEIKSMCSHHHQPVWGLCFIGIIPGKKVIGLSKYIRIAQWYARRGQLQEELTVQIAKHIMDATESGDVAVYVGAKHGCCTYRGVNAFNSLTQTSVLYGAFKEADVKKEFFDQVQLQMQYKE
jgi:GTP cyclohydrolase I